MPFDTSVRVGLRTSIQPGAQDMQLTIFTVVANQFKIRSRQASGIGSRIIKTGTSRSSPSAFILSPQGADAPLLECVSGAKPVDMPVI